MDEKELLEKIKDSNVRTKSRDLLWQCSRYSGQYIHKARGSFKQHFFMYTLEKSQVDFETDLSYKELRERHPEEYRKTISAILECLEKKIVEI